MLYHSIGNIYITFCQNASVIFYDMSVLLMFIISHFDIKITVKINKFKPYILSQVHSECKFFAVNIRVYADSLLIRLSSKK